MLVLAIGAIATPAYADVGDEVAVEFASGGYDGGLDLAFLDGTNKRRVANGAQPAVSPDGETLATSEHLCCAGQPRIILVRADGSDRHALYDDGEGGGSYTTPAWSPDARNIAFDSNGQGDLGAGVATIGVDGTGVTSLGRSGSSNPSYAPNGALVFDDIRGTGSGCADSECNTQVLVRETNGTYRQLTSDDAATGLEAAERPRVGPDGQHVVFAGYGGTGYTYLGTFMVNMDGTNLKRVTGTSYMAPTFTPDGQRLLAQGPGWGEVSSLALDGSDARLVLTDAKAPAVRQPTATNYDALLAQHAPVLAYDSGEKLHALSPAAGTDFYATGGPSTFGVQAAARADGDWAGVI